MKHSETILSLLSELHDPWMDQSECDEFDRIMTATFGNRLDADIEAGIKNGHSPEEQLQLCRQMLRNFR